MDQRWRRTASGNARERIQYGFDRNGNRTFRDNLVASSGQDEYYSYDNLNQLLVLKRGDLNGGRTDISGTPVWQEDFTLDPTGNWRGTTSGYVTRNNGVVDLDQNRGNNMVNEITAITTTSGTAWTVPTYDAGGNMTTLARPGALGSGYSAKYDAWHRLVELKAGSTVVGAYRYDGTHRRVSKWVGSDTTHFYYSKQWQILEERLNASSSAARQFVWGMRYIDDLILRDQGGTRHYVLHDFFNVTAIVNTSGTVQERYGYNAYGECRVMTGSFGNRSSSSYNWETRYGAYRWDAESGLYQVRYRYLHPLLGVWLSRDPIGERGGSNAYTYVRNTSINAIDVFGLRPECISCWDDYDECLVRAYDRLTKLRQEAGEEYLRLRDLLDYNEAWWKCRCRRLGPPWSPLVTTCETAVELAHGPHRLTLWKAHLLAEHTIHALYIGEKIGCDFEFRKCIRHARQRAIMDNI